MKSEYRFAYNVAKPNRFADRATIESLISALESRHLCFAEGTHTSFTIGDPKKIDMSAEAIAARLKLTSHLRRLGLSQGKMKKKVKIRDE